jgi:hypothetical protein
VLHTGVMANAGASRERLAGILGTAFADGLLSENTLSHRLGLLFGQRLVDPHGVVGDLSIRERPRRRRGSSRRPAVMAALSAACRLLIAWPDTADGQALVLALDWERGDEDLVIGRAAACQVALTNPTVSRRHARLVFRDGGWMIEDLVSTNGTFVNDASVGRCRLAPGDRLRLGDQLIDLD